MSDDWRTDLNRLAECYPTWRALAEEIGWSPTTVREIYNSDRPAVPEFKEAVREHREQLKHEHTIAASMHGTFQQAIIRLRDAESIHEVHRILDRTEEVLSDQREKLCDDS